MNSGSITAPDFRGATRELNTGNTAISEQRLARVMKQESDTNSESVYFPNYRLQITNTATIENNFPEELDRRVEALYKAAREEFFEEGMASVFSKGLLEIIARYGNFALVAIAPLIINVRVNVELASETLRWLGHMENSASYKSRLWLAERSLLSSSARIRDSAALCLATLDDPHSVPYLKQAAQNETCVELRENMKDILARLERSR